MGTSVTRSVSPLRARTSRPILNPSARAPASSRRSRRTAKKPDIGSRTSVRGHASKAAARDMSRRLAGQPGVEPPGT